MSQSKSNQGSSSSGRLLQLRLSDGHSFLKAIEHRHVPSLSLDIAPGTKVEENSGVSMWNSTFELVAEAVLHELSIFLFILNVLYQM